MSVDRSLEEAIERVGRRKVFRLASRYGWTCANPPPRAIWWRMVEEIARQHELPLEQKERPAP